MFHCVHITYSAHPLDTQFHRRNTVFRVRNNHSFYCVVFFIPPLLTSINKYVETDCTVPLGLTQFYSRLEENKNM